MDEPAIATGFTPISSSASTMAICARPRAPPAPSASAKVFTRYSLYGSFGARLAREAPGRGREGAHHQRTRGRIFIRRGAIAHASDDALQDRGETEEVVGEIDRQMWPRIEPGACDVSIDVVA